ncbi:hypothetical protein [Peribacillus frigoritolerans]|uniref:hypothetical protein n=1 Tax=Peribacillus castrilensis TaxID=2897690 RepID=UPI002DC7AEA5|nr:hypothetical protein [Peribacillus castrilensis]
MADSRRKGSGFLKSTQRFSNKKTAGKLALYIFLFYENVIGWIKFATLLPNNWLAETPQALCAEEAWQTVSGKGADF